VMLCPVVQSLAATGRDLQNNIAKYIFSKNLIHCLVRIFMQLIIKRTRLFAEQ